MRPARRRPGSSASPGFACLLDATRIIREGFAAVAGVDQSYKRVIVLKAIEESRAPLACAAADPATQAEARALDDLLQQVPAALEEQAKAE